MSALLKKILFSLSVLFISFLGITNVLAQTKPFIFISPNPVPAGSGATFFANTCPANTDITFFWDKNGDGESIDTHATKTNGSGEASYSHNEFSGGEYEAWVECGGQSSQRITYQAVGDCSYVNNLSISANSGQPYKANETVFTVKGQIPNCTQKAGETRVRIFFTLNEGEEQFTAAPVINNSGNFQLEDILFPEPGTWLVRAVRDLDELGGNNSATVTIEGEAEKIACGQEFVDNGDGRDKCADGCIAQSVDRSKNLWKCESEEDTEIRSGCLPHETRLEQDIPQCDDRKTLSPAIACEVQEEAGISECESTEKMCYDGDELTIENLRCERNELPAPPPPPCATDLSSEAGLGGCQEVSTAFGAFQTDPEGFINKLFGILLSISGGVALLLILRSGYQLMVSRGDPEQIKEARERLTSAIIGLLFMIFSLVILEVIGVDILGIPGLS